MRIAVLSTLLLTTSLANAAIPINGWYYGLFGGYTYIPDNINTASRSNAGYNDGYDGGGNFGFKSNSMRYEGELTYLNAGLNKFNLNGTPQTGVTGHSNAFLAMANIYYDFNGTGQTFQPYLGVGIGYAWVHASLSSTGPFGSSDYSGSNNVFAYQGAAGLTYNFAENYAVGVGYRYIGTKHANNLGKSFQANLANVCLTYRFDGNRYK